MGAVSLSDSRSVEGSIFDYRLYDAGGRRRANRRMPRASIGLPDNYGLSVSDLAARLKVARNFYSTGEGA